MRLIRGALWTCVGLGIGGVLVFGINSLIDWAALQAAYPAFERLAARSQGMSTVPAALFVAESAQNVYRLNLFAEGVWTLLSAILAAIGFHGLYNGLMDARRQP